MCEPQRELGRVMVFIYKGNSSATAKSKLLVTGGSGGLTSSLARHELIIFSSYSHPIHHEDQSPPLPQLHYPNPVGADLQRPPRCTPRGSP